MNKFSPMILATVICGASGSLHADENPTMIDQCLKKFTPADLFLQFSVSTNLGCPLLEDTNLRKLIDKFGTGSVFAYPAQVGTCLSGTALEGSTITVGADDPISVEGYSESAQRLFPESEAIGGPLAPLFVSGLAESEPGSYDIPFASGAAMTVLSLNGVSADIELDLVLADRFTIDFSGFPFINTEDFSVVGAKGDYKAVGRLVGQADIYVSPDQPLENVEFTVSGTICLK